MHKGCRIRHASPNKAPAGWLLVGWGSYQGYEYPARARALRVDIYRITHPIRAPPSHHLRPEERAGSPNPGPTRGQSEEDPPIRQRGSTDPQIRGQQDPQDRSASCLERSRCAAPVSAETIRESVPDSRHPGTWQQPHMRRGQHAVESTPAVSQVP